MARKGRKPLAFPREPDDTLAAQLKACGPSELLDVLGPALDVMKTEPRAHQIVSTLIGIDNSTWLFANDMGSGKTKVAIDLFAIRREMGEVDRALVTCPPIVMRHWAKEIRKHSDCTVELVDGSAEQKIRQFAQAEADFVVCSHPWIVRLMSAAIETGKHAELIENRVDEFDMLVVDEAHALKNPASKGFEGYAQFLIEIPFRYLLTGTPVGNDFTGVWSLYYLLDRGETYLASYDVFLRKWFYTVLVKGRFPVHRLHKHKREDFFDRFWDRAIRYEEGELHDLPEKTSIPISVDMDKQQRRVYAELLDVDPTDDDAAEASIWELMSVTGGVHDGLGSATPSPKLEAVLWIVDEVVVSRGDPLIVWHWLVPEGELIAAYLRKKLKGLKVGEVRGNITKAKKDETLEQWASGEIDVLVANPASLGSGVDLYETNVAVYYSNSFSMIHRSQSEKRIHRDGQTRHCYYYDLTCAGTIDEVIAEALGEKRDAFAKLTRDQAWREVRRRFG